MADTIDVTTPADDRPLVSEADLRDIARRAGEGDRGMARRLAARESYLQAALPDRVKHLWRFTDPASLLPRSLEQATLPAPPVLEPVPGAAATIDLWPGQAPQLDLGADLSAGALSLAPGLIGTDHATDSVFTMLNEAAWNTGLGLQVKAGVCLPGPVHLRVHAGGAATLPRVTIAVGAGAEATIVEEHCGGGPEARVAGRTEIIAGDGARVRHVLVQLWDEGTRGHLTVFTRGGRDADLLTAFGTFGGDMCKTEIMTELSGDGAHSEMVGVALACGDQRFDMHTRHRHAAGRTTSNIDFKAVAADRARSTYTGLIRIEEKARHCEAFQENRNLLLSSRSRADAIPELEIHNQEVSCSHGATVAPIDPEQLFYLQSRGLEPGEAIGLVVRGFLENTLSRLPGTLRGSVEGFVGPRLARIREETV